MSYCKDPLPYRGDIISLCSVAPASTLSPALLIHHMIAV